MMSKQWSVAAYRTAFVLSGIALIAGVAAVVLGALQWGVALVGVALLAALVGMHLQTRLLIDAVNRRSAHLARTVAHAAEEQANRSAKSVENLLDRATNSVAEAVMRASRPIHDQHEGRIIDLDSQTRALARTIAGLERAIVAGVRSAEVHDTRHARELGLVSRTIADLHGSVHHELIVRNLADLQKAFASNEAILVAELDAAFASVRAEVSELRASIERTGSAIRDDASTSAAVTLQRIETRAQRVEKTVLDQFEASAASHHRRGVRVLRNIDVAVDAVAGVERELRAAGDRHEQHHRSVRAGHESLVALLGGITSADRERGAEIDARLEGLAAQSDDDRALRAEVSEKLAAIGAFSNEDRSRRAEVSHRLEALAALLEQGRSVGEGEQLSGEALSAALGELRDQGSRLQRAMAEGFRATRVEIEQVPQAVDQYAMMRSTLAEGSLTMPPSGGWAMTAGALSEVIARVLASETAPTVVELGSGISTVWSSLAMRRRGDGIIWSMEHEQRYLDETAAALARDGAPEYTNLLLAPLVPIDLHGETYHWYDLSALPEGLEIDVLVVDGPPGDGGRLARFPALPLLADRLRPGALILLDDTIRFAEKKIIEQWMALFDGLRIERRLEKSTLLRWEG